MTIGIGSTHCLLPADRVAVVDLPEFAMLAPEDQDFATSCGIETVGVFGHGPQTELAAKACRALLDQSPLEPDVLLLVGSRAPDVLLGSDPCAVQAAAKLPGAFAFGIDGLGCTGSSAAWALARDLLNADPRRDSVIIAHTSRPTGPDRVRNPVTVVGDGAFATTIVRGGRPVLRAHRMETDGTFHDLFTVDYRQAPWYEWREECRSHSRYRFELAMHSRLRLGALVDGVLADAKASRKDVTTVLMQNVTASAFGFYEDMLELPIHPMCRENLEVNGHLGAMDVVLNLDRLLAGGTANPGDLVLVLNNSPVAAWAATLWEV